VNVGGFIFLHIVPGTVLQKGRKGAWPFWGRKGAWPFCAKGNAYMHYKRMSQCDTPFFNDKLCILNYLNISDNYYLPIKRLISSFMLPSLKIIFLVVFLSVPVESISYSSSFIIIFPFL